jgi:uncharacterized membrane protein YkgB
MDWLNENAIHFLRIGLGIVFLWFGALKLVPGLSPAEELVVKTVSSVVDPGWFLPTLAIWECAIGINLLINRFMAITLVGLLFHMGGTFMPLVACPDEVWTQFPHALTLEGQYIVKNFVIIGAAAALIGSLHRRRTPERPRQRYVQRVAPGAWRA